MPMAEEDIETTPLREDMWIEQDYRPERFALRCKNLYPISDDRVYRFEYKGKVYTGKFSVFSHNTVRKDYTYTFNYVDPPSSAD